jgi:DNA-binding MarR family transcriptional regulator
MFGEPAWDMLLVLYMSEQHGSRPTISSLTQFSGARPTTALRWLDYLEAQQLIGRETHPTDRRAALVWITDKAREALDSYLCETLGTEA